MWNSAQGYVPVWIGEEFGGRVDTYICLAESPETVTKLLTNYTSIRNVFGVKHK